MSPTTIGIIVAIIVIVAVLIYVFKDKIFGKDDGGSEPPFTPPTPPTPPTPGI